ncbi:MAG: hypothetical protein EAZ60_18805 [Oscillatoriales cyanobacterium]|nr:MAG: hypothetical protein EAZ60_18805 [Oscillatoriales cyanobacterium]
MQVEDFSPQVGSEDFSPQVGSEDFSPQVGSEDFSPHPRREDSHSSLQTKLMIARPDVVLFVIAAG